MQSKQLGGVDLENAKGAVMKSLFIAALALILVCFLSAGSAQAQVCASWVPGHSAGGYWNAYGERIAPYWVPGRCVAYVEPPRYYPPALPTPDAPLLPPPPDATRLPF